MTVLALVLLSALMLCAAAPAHAQPARQTARDRIAVEVARSAPERHGLLGTLLTPVEERDLTAAEEGLISHLRGKTWLEVVREEGEAAVAITRCHQRQVSRRMSKDGKSVNVEFRYTVSGTVAIEGERETLDAEVPLYQTYRLDASRQTPTDYQDRSAFKQAGGQLGPKVSSWILERMRSLRPDGPDAGFAHEVKHRWLVRGDGLEVTAVASGSPAERAGLRAGDRIRRVDGEDGTSEMDEKVRTWRLLEAGTKVQLEVERNKERQKIDLVLEPRTPKAKPAPKRAGTSVVAPS